MNQHNYTPTLQNSAAVPTLVAQADPAPGGTCEAVGISPILPIGTCLLYTGQLLFFCGSSNNPTEENLSADFLRNGSAVWDMNNGTFTRPPIPELENGLPTDFFCPGQAFFPDGRLLVAGGTFQYDVNGHGFQGSPETHIFDPFAPLGQQWTRQQQMAGGRWYPTLVTLGDGRILAVSGLDQNGGLNLVPEIFDLNQNGWTQIFDPNIGDDQRLRLPQYAHLFLLRDGRIFYSGGFMGNGEGLSPCLVTLPQGPGQEIAAQFLPPLDNGDQAASVLLPPAQDQRVMIMGGGGDNDGDPATDRVSIIDLRSDNPTYVAAAPLLAPRQHVSAVLLPDHTVFVCGGSRQHEMGGGQATLTAEIYNPTTNTWTPAATAQYARLYHSNALLLPDGRVLTNGGNPNRGTEELHLEIYSPPYLSMGPQPQIQNVPDNLTYGQTIQIQTPQAGDIQWVSLIRPTSTTHSCNTEQRLVDLEINDFTGNTLTATLLANESNTVPNIAPNIAPPGWYMLFIVDGNGVPSVASWVQLRLN